MITIYKDITEVKEGACISIDTALTRIKEGNSQKKVNLIRNSKNKNERSKIKQTLPSICFSGTFSERKDSCLLEHSGFVILDFDAVEDLSGKKKRLIADEYTYACWISPSGNGLKALVKIPKDPEKHENYYLALIEKYPELDTTSKNLSRVCYESFDREIYINKSSKTWSKQKAIEKLKDVKPVSTNQTTTNYHVVERVLTIVRDSVDGEKHAELLKASKLAGGYIAGNQLVESEIVRLLEIEIVRKGPADEKAAFKTIQKGIERGKHEPIYDFTPERTTTSVNSKIKQKPTEVKDGYFSTKESEATWLKLARENKIPQGLDIGSKHFDNHFRLKKKTMVGLFGIDNVGKTTFHHFMAVSYSKRHGVNWVLICKENTGQTVRQKIIELYCGKSLHKCSDEEYQAGKDFAYKYFEIIDDNYTTNMDNFFGVMEKIYSEKHYFAVFIDPYNAIQHEQTPNKNYKFLDDLRSFQRKHDMSFHISMHIATDKARNFVYGKKETITSFDNIEHNVVGQMKIPRKSFVEGGQPIANKLDDIIIVHRLPKLPELRNYTLVDIEKVKEEKTGGMQSFDVPIMFEKTFPYDTFIDKDGINPVSAKQEANFNSNKSFNPHKFNNSNAAPEKAEEIEDAFDQLPN